MRSRHRMGRLLAVSLLALAAGACRGDGGTRTPTAPDRPRLAEGSAVAVTTRAVLSRFGAGGPQVQPLPSRAFVATVHEGRAIELRRRGARAAGEGDSIPNLTPVVALLDGELATPGTEETIDSAGVTWRTEASAPLGAPVSRVVTYRDGVISSEASFDWQPVDGGFVLAHQTMASYVEGARAAEVNIEVTTTTTAAADGAPRLFLAATAARLLDQAVCWLAPRELLAQGTGSNPCFSAGLSFLGATAGLAAATAVMGAAYPIAPIAIVGYMGVWAGWTGSMINFLSCMGKKK